MNRDKLRIALRKALKEDLFALGKALGLRVDNLSPTHFYVAKVSSDRSRRKNKLILLPRGHLKSTLFCVLQSIYDVIRYPDERQLIASATLSLSYSLLEQIKSLVEQNAEFLNWVYPEIFWRNPAKESPIWRQNALLFKRSVVHKEATIEIASTEKSITGRHYDIIRLDDVVAEVNSQTAEQLSKVINWYQMLTPIIDKRYYGQIHITGTRWHLNDLYGHILDNEKELYDILVYKAHDDNFDNILWDYFTPDEFKKLRKTMTEYQYSCQYLNEPLSSDQQIFFPEFFRYDQFPNPERREYNVVMIVDPAISEKETADNSGIVIMAYWNNMMYVLHSWAGKLSVMDLVNKLIEEMVRYDVDVIGIETVAYQKALKEVLVEKLISNGYNIPIIEELKPDRDKVRRAYQMAAYVQQGRVAIPPMDRRLIKELIEFPQGRYDDLVDAFVYHAYLFPKYNQKIISVNREENKRMGVITGQDILDRIYQKMNRSEGYDFSE